MTIYNINLGIGWASSGVEYAQIYRAKLLRSLGEDIKFIFMDFISSDNIQHLTANIGFYDSEVIWLYQYFTDVKIAPTSYTLETVRNEFGLDSIQHSINREGNIIRIETVSGLVLLCKLSDVSNERVESVEIIDNGNLIQKHYYSYVKYFVEYYGPNDGKATLYQRNWLNEDGSVAYEEYIDLDGDKYVTSLYRFKDNVFYTKQEFVSYFIKCLSLNAQDILILDRETEIGQAIFENKGESKLVVIVHADHFSEDKSQDETVLWNNYYEYQFRQVDRVDAIVTSTDAQTNLLRYQFERFEEKFPNIITIPVGSLSKLCYPIEERPPYKLLTASRLATEKHIDWLIKAVVKAKSSIPELTLDIYGMGGEAEKLSNLIATLGAQDYIKLLGHHKMEHVYKTYSAYLSASTSEGFGLTLMEAVGSGLPLIGFDVRYGNPTFIRQGENGYLLDLQDGESNEHLTERYAQAIEKLFTLHKMDDLHKASYEVAESYLHERVAERWRDLFSQLRNEGGR